MRKSLVKTTILSGWILVSICVFLSAQDEQLVLSESAKRNISTLFPEGWSFFTKNPRDFSLSAYRIQGGDISLVDATNQKEWFGFSRAGRLVGYEISTVAADIRKKYWKHSSYSDLPRHIGDSAIIISNRSYFRHLVKGEYLLTSFEPIPYAWANSKQEKFRPMAVVKIVIK